MEVRRAIWTIRFAGLVLFVLSYVALCHSSDISDWFVDRIGEREWLGVPVDNVMIFAIPVITAIFLRATMFGMRIWARVGLVFLVFLGLYMVVSYQLAPAVEAHPYPWAGELRDMILWLLVFPPATFSFILAAVPMFDARFRQPHANAGTQKIGR